jgi:hypothetical protein
LKLFGSQVSFYVSACREGRDAVTDVAQGCSPSEHETQLAARGRLRPMRAVRDETGRLPGQPQPDRLEGKETVA